jgi:hypothetical protein
MLAVAVVVVIADKVLVVQVGAVLVEFHLLLLLELLELLTEAVAVVA